MSRDKMSLQSNMSLTTLALVMLSLLSIAKAQSVAFEIQEEQPPPILIGNIGVAAKITSVPGLSYALLQKGNNFEEMFEVDKSSGDLHTLRVLDREQLCGSLAQCILVGSVLVSSSEPNSIRRFQVNITVVDANDQRPTWTTSPYTLVVSERTAVNTTFQLPVAEDDDYEPFFKVQRYALESNGSSVFDLSVRKTTQTDGYFTFEVYLRLTRKLDRERQDKYSMALIAYDGNGPSSNGRLPLVVDVGDENDNAPEFSAPRYVSSVEDVTLPGTTVLAVTATDADAGENARIGYMFPNEVDKRIQELFRLDPVTGELKLNQSLGKETTLTFKVRAFDHGKTAMSSDVEVVINVDDTLNDPPRMDILRTEFNGTVDLVKEDAPVTTVIAFVDAIDNDGGDNGKVTCSVVDDYFELNKFSDKRDNYVLVVAKELDRETQDTHKLTINCEDKGTPPLITSVEMTISVTDVNDFFPEFTKQVYRMSVRENQLQNLPVGSVHASDKDAGANADVRYSLPADVVEFSIDYNGLITTAVRDLDRESKETYRFDVYAFDMADTPRTATASVVVTVEDLNDEWPKFDFSSYHFRISENSEVDSVVGKLHATDLDLGKGGVVEYVLVHSPRHPDPPFTLSQESGSMTLNRALDYEEEEQYKFVVTAIDLGDPPRSSTVQVVIDLLDENDNPPVITFPSSDNLSVTLNLNVIPGHEVIQVIAHDADSGDNGRLSYSMTAAPNTTSEEVISRLFWMNEDTGLVTLVSPLTPTDARTYDIVVNVQDQGLSPQRATQAMLVVQVVQESDQTSSSRRESYTTIVIAMVCVTLLVAVIVLVILCYIKYSDRRRYLKSKGPDGHIHLHNHAHSDHQFDHKPATPDPTSGKYDLFTLENCSSSDGHDGSGDRSVDPLDPSISPNLQTQPLKGHQNHARMGSGPRNGKKSVTFDSKVRSSDNSLNHNSASSSDVLHDPAPSGRGDRYSVSPVPSPFFAPASQGGRNFPSSNIIFNPNVTHNKDLISHPHSQSPSPLPLNHHQDLLNKNVGWAGSGTSSFRPSTSSSPSPFPGVSNTPSAYPPVGLPANIRAGPGPQATSSGPAPEDMAGVALQKHNALVRSMRAHGRRPAYAGGQPRRTSGEADICSSSSVETNDSGHGGSELDVSVLKANV